MAKVLVDDALWELIEPHLPRRKPRRTGRPRVPDRAALTGIVFVLQTGVPWEYLPLQWSSPIAGSNTAAGWARRVGSSNGPSVGSTSSNGFVSAANAAPTFTKR